MVFSSPFFIFLFLPTVLGLYYSVRADARNWILLAASIAFYAWAEASFLSTICASIALNYLFGIALGSARGATRKWVLAAAVFLNLGLLAYYKYANLAVFSVAALYDVLHWRWSFESMTPVALPLGISFYTFHSLSYVVDIYRRNVKPQQNLPKLALYLLLFPQLIAGPIIRYHEIAHQLGRRHVSTEEFAAGIRRFVIGLSKKTLVANTVAGAADIIFALEPGRLSRPLAWIGAASYAIQIYFDFSGYSDMAIGLAHLFGFTFPENFDYPYSSNSITEFWRRWHISLSRWFRDYLYIPLGGNRVGSLRRYANLLIVFSLCGLWHGAAWSFLIWGLYHGGFLIVERVAARRFSVSVPKVMGRAYALLVVTIGWVLFRSPTLSSALTFLGAMVGFGAHDGREVAAFSLNNEHLLALATGAVLSLPVLPWAAAKLRQHDTEPRDLAWSIAATAGTLALFFLCVLRFAAGTYNPFIYFRF